MKKKIFLICPVRNITKKEEKKIRQFVEDQERQGNKVHWPPRDTNQDDPIGIAICSENGFGIWEADEIDIWWVWKEKKWWQKWMWWIKEKKSTGSLFDVGMTFMLYLLRDILYESNLIPAKKIILANPEEVKWTDRKSFNNVLLTLHRKNTEGERK